MSSSPGVGRVTTFVLNEIEGVDREARAHRRALAPNPSYSAPDKNPRHPRF